ncbi:ABC transporter permease [Chlamydia sp. 17-3921]|uniref:ABC transporter permease n=1 Tax=Chlamydia sp. 17-3921 TaxID=2675798 RepID=UPI001917DDE5|nr:FtsX-like permease family protein [Chlamydia sp. 17-3921]
MKLELFIAIKYLIPRRKRISSSIVSLFSMGIISLVVWLSVVFISVIHGLEQRWLNDLSQLHAPITMLPSKSYYDSYFYQIDKHSELSNYTTKTLGEKLLSSCKDPYDSETDYLLSQTFPKPDLDFDGTLKDPVATAVQALTPYLVQKQAQILEFEEGIGNLYIDTDTQKSLSQTFSHFIAYSSKNFYENRILPYEESDYCSKDLNNLNRSPQGWKEDFHRLQERYQGSSIILPINYKDLGYKIGDKGSFSTYTLETQKETHYKVHIIGFYNPGLSPLGAKTIFIDSDLAASIRSSSEGLGMNNGFRIFFANTKDIRTIKAKIQKILTTVGIHDYWEVVSLYDYEYFKPILDQLQSDQVLFLFVTIIILIVACSNIVTMSILLVNNKKKEIGALKAMGISSKSLKQIFAFCGAISGSFGMLLGTLLAIITLKNLEVIVKGLSYLQGRNAFNPIFFGENLPNIIHPQAILWLSFGTLILATISGVLPARKVAKMQVSEILKAD